MLGRFVNSIRAQNWSTFVVEFIVVVVGIFAGLQVDGWNERRKESIREQVHLQQLYADTQSNILLAESLVDHHEEMVGGITSAITALKRGSLEPDEASGFKWTILTLGRMPPMNLAMGAYDTLLASGDFALLSDQELKNQLVQIASLQDFEKEFRIAVLPDFELPDDMERTAISAVPHPSGKGLEWRVDFEYLRDHRDTFQYLASIRYGHTGAHGRMNFMLENLQALKLRLEQIMEAEETT